MADRGMIFSAPMVLALLAGRKTQTRRVLTGAAFLPCAVGDRLWVREGHALVPATAYRMSDGVEQRLNPGDHDQAAVYRAGWERCAPRWRSPIHMPRWASRLTLTVTDVRDEQLQAITDADAIAEGVEMESADPPFYYVPGIWPHNITAVGVEDPGGRHAARSYAKLWNHIHGAGSWDRNLWVAAIAFTVERRNIDG